MLKVKSAMPRGQKEPVLLPSWILILYEKKYLKASRDI